MDTIVNATKMLTALGRSHALAAVEAGMLLQKVKKEHIWLAWLEDDDLYEPSQSELDKLWAERLAEARAAEAVTRMTADDKTARQERIRTLKAELAEKVTSCILWEQWGDNEEYDADEECYWKKLVLQLRAQQARQLAAVAARGK